MAKDYLEELRKYTAGGGKDLGEFLKMHTVSPQGTVSGVTQPPADVAAQLRAADSQARMGVIAGPGNVITQNAMRPVSAESDALQAKMNARNADPLREGSGLVVPAANAPGSTTSPTFAPTPRRIAPIVESSIAANKPKDENAPWWLRGGDLREDRFSGMGVGENRFGDIRASRYSGGFGPSEQEKGRADRDNSFIRLNRNTFIPATQAYNRNSSL